MAKAKTKTKDVAAATTTTETSGLLSGTTTGVDDEPPLVDENTDSGPRKSMLYKLFMIVSGLASIVCGIMIGTEIWSAVLLSNFFIQYVLRVYIILFCILFIMAELQVKFILRKIPALANWFHRGFLYTLIGVVVMEEAYATLAVQYPNANDSAEEQTGKFELHVHTISMLLRVSSFAMFIIGILYMLMGAMCLKGVWEDMQTNYRLEVEHHQREIHSMDV